MDTFNTNTLGGSIMFLFKAIENLSTNGFILYDDNSIKYDSKDGNPTQAEIDAEVIRLQAEYDNQQYQRDRQYPSLEEQADMAYWDRKNGTTTLDDALDAVKAEYPKPTE